MSGRGNRDKGNRAERALVRFLQSYGFADRRTRGAKRLPPSALKAGTAPSIGGANCNTMNPNRSKPWQMN
jgi:hypothetical protein